MSFSNERYFFFSGLISLSFFFLLLLLIGYSVLQSTKIEQFAMVQSQYVSVSIAITEAKNEPQEVTQVPEPISEPVEQVPTPPEPVKTQPAKSEPVPDISDLFSQVKAEQSPKNKPADTKRSQELSALEKEVLKSSNTPSITDKVKNLELVKPSLKMVVQGGSSGPVVNEYHAKIHGLVYTHFHPPIGSGGQAVRVRMVISASGKLIGYKVITYSGNSSLNSEVDWLKERLSSVVFPPHPEGRDAILEFILTAKE